jgi:IS30 family transposase
MSRTQLLTFTANLQVQMIGMEACSGAHFLGRKSFTGASNVKVYFCDPQSPWQRGTNENTNGPVRQYFPKRTSRAVEVCNPLRDSPLHFSCQRVSCQN